jgi:hypothetical protein
VSAGWAGVEFAGDRLRFVIVAFLAAAAWLALYRLPWRTPRARQRLRLAVTSRTGMPAKYVFPVVGTAVYLLLGLAATAVVGWAGDAPVLSALRWRLDGPQAALTVLAVTGASALTAFAMSMLYSLAPGIDVPGAVGSVRWIQEVLVLPGRWRWVAPMTSAAVEEVFFRGTVLTGLIAAGFGSWAAVVVAGALFTIGQVILTENRVQAMVLGSSSVVLSVVGGLLVVVTGSVLPAIVVHAASAGFYTNLPQPSAGRPSTAVSRVPF